MKPRICICCGEPMIDRGNTLSRNPNVCASCSSLADGMDEIVVNELDDEQDESAVVEIAARPGTTEEAAMHEPIRVDPGRTHKNSGLGTR